MEMRALMKSKSSPKDGNDLLTKADPTKVDQIAALVREMMLELGLDVNEPNLRETDRRVAKMYIEMFSGLQLGSEPQITTFPNDEGYNEMVMVKEIPFYSMCSHHFVPFYGHVHVAYIPNDRIV